MRCSTFLSFVALPGALAFPWNLASKRAGATDATFYAYGTNISGNSLLYSSNDGTKLPTRFLYFEALLNELKQANSTFLRQAQRLPAFSRLDGTFPL